MTSHIRPGPLGSTEHDVSRGLSKQRPMLHGHGAHPVQPRVVQVPASIGSACTSDEFASETQCRQLPTALRVTHMDASQENAATDGERNKWQRLQNHASSDVSHLIAIFKDTVARMDAAGERSPGSGDLNGWKNNWLSGTGYQPKYLKCADQAAEVMAALAMRAQTRAKWTYTYEQRIPGPVPLHVWVKAQSDNPGDPVLHFDAWSNEVRVEPVTQP